MARINFEDRWWTDPRRSALIRATGSEEFADGLVAKLWRVAQEFWGEGSLIPYSMFRLLPNHRDLLDVGMARAHVDNDPNSEQIRTSPERSSNERSKELEPAFVYCSGAVDLLSWLAEKRDLARLAGQKSAEARRRKTGSAQPSARTKPEQTSNEPRTDVRTLPNDAEPSGSCSSSGSSSGSSKGIILTEKDFDQPCGFQRDDSSYSFVLGAQQYRTEVNQHFLAEVPTSVLFRWEKTYPDHVWLRRELDSASLWLHENPSRQRKNKARFFGNWFRNAANPKPTTPTSYKPGAATAQARTEKTNDQFARVERGEL